jgi:hypothetical protein
VTNPQCLLDTLYAHRRDATLFPGVGAE